MEYHDKEYCLEVWGDFACFTRPELKVERVSYDVITPSAARAIFEAIFWKPAIHWQVTRIEVLNPIRWFNIKRNEVGKTMSPSSDGLIIEENRQQRSSMILRNVRYRILHGRSSSLSKTVRLKNNESMPRTKIQVSIMLCSSVVHQKASVSISRI